MADPKRKIVFMGSPDFAVPTLEALIASPEFDVAHVVTQPDRPKGRGKKLCPTAVRSCAVAHDLPALEMTRDNYGEIVEKLRGLAPDFIVVAAFGVILRKDLLSLPSHGCINLHASLLPRHRGVSPIQESLLAGDPETGCTTMLMDEGIDTGDILLAVSTSISEEDTTGTIESRLADLGAPLMLRTLSGLLCGEVGGRKQDDRFANYTKKIRKEHGRIDWDRSAVDIWRQVRAMSPWPTAYTEYGGNRLIVLAAAVIEAVVETRPGVIASVKPLRVGTGRGLLELHSVKPAGRKAVSAEAFVSGYHAAEGEKLG